MLQAVLRIIAHLQILNTVCRLAAPHRYYICDILKEWGGLIDFALWKICNIDGAVKASVPKLTAPPLKRRGFLLGKI